MSFNSYNKGVQSADDLLKVGTGYCARPDPKRMEPPEYDIGKYSTPETQAGPGAQPRALGRAGSYDSHGASYKDPSKSKEFVDPKYAFLFKGMKKKPAPGSPQAQAKPKVNVTDRISYSGYGGSASNSQGYLHTSPTRKQRRDDDERGRNFGWVYMRLAVAMACAITIFTMFSIVYANRGLRGNKIIDRSYRN